jgi:NADH:ubiquinone oxidoreductase subunit K
MFLSISFELFSLSLVGILRNQKLLSLLLKLEFSIFNSKFFFSKLLASFLNISGKRPVLEATLDEI